VGRLDNIIARNRGRDRWNERLTTSLVLGAIVLLILALAVFTDLGVPPEAATDAAPGARPGDPAAGPHGPPPADHKRVDGVLLFTPRAKPARR